MSRMTPYHQINDYFEVFELFFCLFHCFSLFFTVFSLSGYPDFTRIIGHRIPDPDIRIRIRPDIRGIVLSGTCLVMGQLTCLTLSHAHVGTHLNVCTDIRIQKKVIS